jgi:hypothetical protein
MHELHEKHVETLNNLADNLIELQNAAPGFGTSGPLVLKRRTGAELR